MSLASKIIEITISGLPKLPNELNTMHWARKRKEVKNWRTMAAYAARAQRPPKPYTHVELTLIRASSHVADRDNIVASFKSLIDGLIDGGVITDDNAHVVTKIHCEWIYAPPTKGHVKIIVDPIGPKS